MHQVRGIRDIIHTKKVFFACLRLLSLSLSLKLPVTASSGCIFPRHILRVRDHPGRILQSFERTIVEMIFLKKNMTTAKIFLVPTYRILH